MLPLRRVLLPALAVALLVTLAACKSGGGGTTPTPSPAASPSPSPAATPAATPTPSPTPEPTPEAPHAAPIVVGEGEAVRGEGELGLTLGPGESRAFDARDLGNAIGVAVGPCTEFIFYLSWQVRDPFPPDGVDFEVYESLRGARPLVAEGTSGQASLGGCAAFEVVNNSAVEITVELRYLFGSFGG